MAEAKHTDMEIEALRAYAHEATKVITGLAGGGSENFSGQIGDMFKADLEFCAKKIRDRHETTHGLLIRAKKNSDSLLVALKLMLPEAHQWDLHLGPSFETCEKAREAIAKAEGRS